MAYEKVGETLPGVAASADLSGQQFHFITVGATGVALAGDGVQVDGVLCNEPEAGQACTIWGPGSVAKVVAGAAVLAGAAVASDANGEAVTATAGEYIVGRALTAAANANEIISVWITMPGIVETP